MGWKIDYQGAVLREEDVLNAHVTLVNQVLGTTGWDAINPMDSPGALVVWTAVAISENTKTSLDEVLVYVQKLKLHDILACFTADAAPEPPATPPVVRSEPSNPVPGTNGAGVSPEQQEAQRRIVERMIAAGKQ
jgi:hypothetical protein